MNQKPALSGTTTYTVNGNIDRRVDIASNAQWTYDPAH
jgi:hypothetical protein